IRTAFRKEAIFFAALALAAKATVGIGQFFVGVSMDVIGLSPGAAPGSVPEATVQLLGMVYGPGTAVLGVISLILLTGYKLDRKRHADILETLALRRVPKT
ncbi:MAG: MFS transporter, partial [Proteobacteria bacterium]|nr:MFS transporter [Pseudomonadota bacterium]